MMLFEKSKSIPNLSEYLRQCIKHYKNGYEKPLLVDSKINGVINMINSGSARIEDVINYYELTTYQILRIGREANNKQIEESLNESN
jgi:hypothetical protein